MIRKISTIIFIFCFVTNLMPIIFSNCLSLSGVVHDELEQVYYLHAEEKAQKVKNVLPKTDTIQVKEKKQDSNLLIVALVVLTVWIALSIFLIRINRKVTQLEKKIGSS